jgi:PAS domain S-box-containing protein
LRSDGTLLLSYPLNISSLGTHSQDKGPDGFRVTPNIPQKTAFPAKSFVAQVSSTDMPVIIRVMTTPDRVLQKFWQDTELRITLSTLTIAILTGMLFLLLSQIGHVEESEARLRLTQFAVDESPDMILWCDQSGHICYANRTLITVSSYSPKEIRAMGFPDLIGGNELNWERIYAELLSFHRKTLQSILNLKNDTKIAIDMTMSLISDEYRQYICICARDVTERHAEQTELRRHRDHLQELVEERTTEIRTMLDANPLAIMLSVEGHIQSINPAFESLFGYDSDRISGLTENLIHASAASYITLRSAIQECISLGTTYRGEAQLKRSDNSLFWAVLFVRALQSNSPERGALFIIEDISAQREAAQALRESEQIKRAILDTTADGFALIDDTRRFVEVNQALCQKLGFSQSEMLGQTPEILWGETQAQNIFPLPEKRSGLSPQAEVILVQKNGVSIPFLTSWGTIEATPEKSGYVFAFLTDISRQKEIEISLLEAKIAAESANHAKSEFLTKMSHELRTPMHAILSFSELGQHKAELSSQPDILRYFENIQNSGKSLLTMLNDLLSIPHDQYSASTYTKSHHFLQNTMQAAIAEISATLANKSLSITLTETDHPPLIAIYDNTRITQLIINLLSNAIKFSPVGSTIYVSFLYEVGRTRSAHSVIGFSIRDEGPGIGGNRLNKFFDATDPGAMDTMTNGIGLGLSISRAIVRDHGGHIEAANHPEGGAIFTVKLPGEHIND